MVPQHHIPTVNAYTPLWASILQLGIELILVFCYHSTVIRNFAFE